MPKENLSDHPSAYDPKILRKQVRGPRIHSININYTYQTSKFTKCFPLILCAIITSFYLDKNHISNEPSTGSAKYI